MKSWLLKASRYIGIGFILFGLFLLLLVETHHRLQDETMSSWETETDADCALVLTGGPHRVREGFALLSRKQVRHLIVAGVHPATELTDLITPWDLVWGPDLDKIVLEKRSTTTYGNAQQSLPIVEGLGCQKLELITSQLHMYRAYKTLSGSFPESITISKHPVPSVGAKLKFW